MPMSDTLVTIFLQPTEPHQTHSDSVQHLVHTNVAIGDEILPLLSFFHILALIQ